MDEQFDIQKYDMEITEVELSEKKNLVLIRGFEIEKDKKYMRFIALRIGNKIITDKLAQVILFKEELSLFDGTLEENTFLSASTREINKQKIKSMVYKTPRKHNVYFSRADSKAVSTIWNMSLRGYSLTRLMELPTKQSIESWSKYLLKYGYLNKKKEI